MTTERIPELDAVRGLAAIGVVLYHAFPTVFFLGWSCVDLFFVLSGYLITSIVFRDCGKVGFLSHFYLRRICRIWPVYYLTLGVMVLLNMLAPRGIEVDSMEWYLVFLQNTWRYFGMTVPPFFDTFAHSWSVAVEEQFYLFWPLLILAFGKHSVPWLAVSLLGICILVRTRVPEETHMLLFTRGDGLAWGCFLAWLLSGQVPTKLNRIVPQLVKCVGIVGLAFTMWYLTCHWRIPQPQWQWISFSALAMLFFGLIGSCVLWTGSPWLALLRLPLLRWFGTVSYAMYMFHMPIFHFAPPILNRLGIESEVLVSVGMWTCIFALPALSWYCLERPILSLKLGSKAT